MKLNNIEISEDELKRQLAENGYDVTIKKRLIFNFNQPIWVPVLYRNYDAERMCPHGIGAFLNGPEGYCEFADRVTDNYIKTAIPDELILAYEELTCLTNLYFQTKATDCSNHNFSMLMFKKSEEIKAIKARSNK